MLSQPNIVSEARQEVKRPQILCVMRMPPNLNGHGGSQRAWHVLQALRPFGDIHFVLMYRVHDGDCVYAVLDNITPFVESVTRICIDGWKCADGRKFGVIPAAIQNIVNMRSQEAPRISKSELKVIAEKLPTRTPDIIFAARICTAYIINSMIDYGYLASNTRIADYDDIMSKFRKRQIKQVKAMPLLKRLSARFDSWVIDRAERKIARTWDGVSVCTDEDVNYLKITDKRVIAEKLPNVIDRPFLLPTIESAAFRILFVGNLSFIANVDGLRTFILECWPLVKARLACVRLTVVGLSPSESTRRLCIDADAQLHSDVPSVSDYYKDCDVVIAPILFGSGTRVKILEAMAFGRPVVSTSMGAEGMGLKNGEQILLADDMPSFAEALLKLAGSEELRDRLRRSARSYQEKNFAPEAICRAMARLMDRRPAI